MLNLSIMISLVPGPEVGNKSLSKRSQTPGGSPNANTYSEQKKIKLGEARDEFEQESVRGLLSDLTFLCGVHYTA